MHGRALYFGAPYKITDDSTNDTNVLFERSGRNSGNLVIGYSLVRQLNTKIVSMSPEHPPKSKDFDFVAIAAANFLFSGFDFGPFADLVEQVDLPCIMVGLGAQAPTSGGFPQISPGTQRFVKAVADRTARIGVRGAYTAEVLAHLGIKNVEVTGCPSFYLLSPDELSAGLAQKRPGAGLVSLNASRNVMSHSSDPEKMKCVERHIYELCRTTYAQFVLQSETEEMKILTDPDGPDIDRVIAQIRNTLDWQDVPEDGVRELVRSRFKIYFDIDQWRQSLAQCSFSMGSRFHGNLLALLSGVPAHVICHDSRTKELCEFGGVPHSLLADVPEEFSVADFQERTNIGKFIRTHAENYSAYRTFLERNAVPHTLAGAKNYASAG